MLRGPMNHGSLNALPFRAFSPRPARSATRALVRRDTERAGSADARAVSRAAVDRSHAPRGDAHWRRRCVRSVRKRIAFVGRAAPSVAARRRNPRSRLGRRRARCRARVRDAPHSTHVDAGSLRRGVRARRVALHRRLRPQASGTRASRLGDDDRRHRVRCMLRVDRTTARTVAVRCARRSRGRRIPRDGARARSIAPQPQLAPIERSRERVRAARVARQPPSSTFNAKSVAAGWHFAPWGTLGRVDRAPTVVRRTSP